MVTIFSNIFDKKPNYISVDSALNRIKIGKSKDKVEEIRKQIDKERANKLKCNLPSVCFSGKFEERIDSKIIEHSGFIVLDFDGVEDLDKRKSEIKHYDFVYACWVSPSGNGLKALVKIADGKKHREHFTALRDVFPDADKSGINESRVCYESFDEDIYINPIATQFKKITKQETVVVTERLQNEVDLFEKILKWLSNKGDAFVTGERNSFIFKLASACCRFGINESDCQNLCRLSFSTNDSSFSSAECLRTVKSAYKSNASKFSTAEFTKDILVDKKTKTEIKISEINEDIYNLEIRPKDVIFGEDVKGQALNIYENGYGSVQTTGIDILDEYFKLKKAEVTLLTGIGNYGKSTFLKYLLLMKAILFGDKFAIFSPEDNPAEEFYHDIVEILLGCDCTPYNYNKPSKESYEDAFDFISKHFFYVYPKDIAPTPDYIKERFLELIIKEGVTGCVIDPFNQLTNNYGANGRSDKYLETLLSDFLRFSQINNQYFVIVAHPHKLQKDSSGNYPCPDVFDIADGAMWNNKMDNIIVYHRPNHQIEPTSPLCEFHSKKIRRQKIVGKKGVLQFELNRGKRRFYFNGVDFMKLAIDNKTEKKEPTLYEEMIEYVNGKPKQEEFDIF
jgi:hypothetical protein